MKTEKKLNKFIEFLDSELGSIKNKDKTKYLKELIEAFDSKDQELIDQYKTSNTCRERGGAKEFLDSVSSLTRAMDLRKQKEFGIFAIKDYVLLQAMRQNYKNKIENCNAMMSRAKE